MPFAVDCFNVLTNHIPSVVTVEEKIKVSSRIWLETDQKIVGKVAFMILLPLIFFANTNINLMLQMKKEREVSMTRKFNFDSRMSVAVNTGVAG
ncbi:MAG: hypothetical protein ACRC10_00935 [Thermoguttaceae bacterium]